MASIASRFISAGLVTFMDVLVVWCCGPLVWKTWGSFIWSRIGLLALAGGMAFTLMDIWSQTLTKRAVSPFDGSSIQPMLTHAASSVDMEGADV